MWTVKCENFQCHEQKSFTFHPNGLHLLKGSNGVGKSTVLKAIYFAYFGAIRKPYTFGNSKSTTRVTLQQSRYKIVRTRSPNRLHLIVDDTDEYEDEVAQQFISSQILGMNQEQFLLCTYIRPHARTSLVTLTPGEQLKMIESFAFDSDLHSRHKAEITKMIKERKEKSRHLTQKSEIDRQYYERELVEFDNQHYKITSNPSNDSIDTMNTQIVDIQVSIRADRESLKRLQSIDPKSLVELQSLEKEKESLDLVQIDDAAIDNISVLKKKMDREEHRQRVQTKMTEFEELREAYFEEVKRERDKMSTHILSDDMVEYHIAAIKQYNMYEAKIQTYTQNRQLLLNECKKLKTHPDREVQERNELEKALQMQADDERKRCPRVSCPKCSQTLQIKEGTLMEVDDQHPKLLTSKGVEMLKKKIRIQQRRIDVFDRYNRLVEPKRENDDDIDAIRRQYDNHSIHVTKFRALEKNVESQSLSSTLIKMRKGIPESPLQYEPENMDELKAEHQTLIETCAQTKHVRERLTIVNDRLKQLRRQIGDVSLDSVHEKTTRLTTRLHEQQVQLDKSTTTLEQCKEYQRFTVHKKKVDDLCTCVHDNSVAVRLAEQQYAAALKLDKLQSEAEVLSIEDVVEAVNLQAEEYLQAFFEDEPMRVRCEMVKRTQKELKFKVNTSIVYRGVEYASYEELSQGELVKVNLAFILALNAYFSSPLLMLDEMLENLDSEISTEVVSTLQTLSRDKCIVVIDHSSIEGMYDHVTIV